MAVSMDAIMNMYNTYQTQSADKSGDALKDKLSKDYTSATDDELMSVCKEFESYFLEQVFKSMQKMVPEHEYDSTSSKTMMEYYQDELVSSYAKSATDNGEGLGLAKMLYEQMKRNYESNV